MKNPRPRLRLDAARGRGRVEASVFVSLALFGTWFGHSIEYVRVNGPAGFLRVMTHSVHVYMILVGAGLFVLAVVGGAVWLRGVTLLATRLERLRAGLRSGTRCGPAGTHRASSPVPSRMARAGSLWTLLGVMQVALYLVQENVEARVGGLRAPGFGAVVGRHWAAVPIHLVVAGLLALAASGLIRYRRRLEKAVAQHERVHARRWATRPARMTLPSSSPRDLTPHERWGSQRWQRPPPASIAA